MFEIKDLQQLVAIAECGSITRAAQRLYISQPALSRAMQKLEAELGVQLFARGKNRVELNENGQFFVGLARGLLADCNDSVQRVRTFDRERNTLAIGSCAPAPLWEVAKQLGNTLPGRRIYTQIDGLPELLRGLETGTYALIITNQPIERQGVECRFLCSERLLLCLPAEHRLAAKRAVTFDDIDGITMLLYGGIGVWHDVGKRLPHTRFIVQGEYGDFNDLVKTSSLPSFATNLAADDIPGGRICLPVEGEGAVQHSYAAVLQSNKHLLPRPMTAEREEIS